ncbi:hypothetical protein Vretimale_19446 [Volvox reticuliferus]|uniref:Uncharacterized protein n=1 Tax=Volvox reticuliferus TaxID=1737510 RepID=A0A8J4GZC1_9CHLO|nr:hypothetical protein Vretifemale_20187 [Volvox reticuliferus]GIM16860.1 hypothetical protein Vretimale_19446 [Volvox reticuliferus]
MLLQHSILRCTASRPRRCKHVHAASPAWNPQNTPDPLVMPSPAFSPSESVEVSLPCLLHLRITSLSSFHCARTRACPSPKPLPGGRTWRHPNDSAPCRCS